MKILIISANTEIKPDPVFPIGANYVATALKNTGFQVETFDCNFKDDLLESLEKKLVNFNPDFIGISLRNVDDVQFPNYTSYVDGYKSIIEKCRQTTKAIIVLGGTAFSLFPNEFCNFLKPDYGIVGEGEEGFLRLIEDIKSDLSCDKIIYAKRLNLKSFDTIPDRTLFDFGKYYENGGMLNIQTKRGCVFKCSYCTYPYIEGSKLRERNPKNVVDELSIMVDKYNIKHFFFVDSVFNYPEKHALEICNEIIRKNLKIKWSAYIRPQMKDLSILEAMKMSGCKSIELGTDSMSPPTIKSMRKEFTIDDVFRFCDKCNEVNIDFCHSLIFGAPNETFETAKMTVENVQNTNPTAIIAFIGIRILPNTYMAEHCIKTGFIKNHSDIGFEPIFYIEKEVSEGIIDFLKNVMQKDKRWIIPGIEAFNMDLFQSIRKKKKGLMWEMKKFVDYI